MAFLSEANLIFAISVATDASSFGYYVAPMESVMFIFSHCSVESECKLFVINVETYCENDEIQSIHISGRRRR